MSNQMDRRWVRTGRKPDKVIKEVRRTCARRDLELIERQNGTSHWIGKVVEPDGHHRGSLVIPRHGEIRKGTWGTICKMIVKLGLAVLVVAGVVVGLL